MLVEKGGDLDPRTDDFDQIVDRIAHRQFGGLWGSRDHDTGLVPKISVHANEMALNSTAGLIQILPTAVSQQWVSQTQADRYVSQVVETLHRVWDKVDATGDGGYIPPRVYRPRDVDANI